MVRLSARNLEPAEVDEETLIALQKRAVAIRKATLRAIHAAGSGHPGGSLSCIDVLVALYGHVLHMDASAPARADRDYFILSKGHAAPALYATLASYGFFPAEELETLRQLGAKLQGHPRRGSVPGIEVSTGALGVGLSVGVGVALALQLDEKPNRVHVLLGDGECQEGAVWEAAMAAAHYRLDNLVAIVDRNGLQIDGSTEKTLSIEPLAAKWEAMGWHVVEIDGTSFEEILGAFRTAKALVGKPTVIVAYLVKGHGTNLMEHVKKFHGAPPTDEELAEALAFLDEIARGFAAGGEDA